MTTTDTLRCAGLRLFKLSQVAGDVYFEKPVSVNNAILTGRIRLGRFTYFGGGCRVIDANIGRYCSIGREVTINLRDHPMTWLSTHPFQYNGTRHFEDREEYHALKGPLRIDKAVAENRVRIGNDVWIGDRVMIKRGIKIGDGAILAAGSMITHDVEPYMIVGGAPARVIRPRFEENLVRRMLRLRWWRWDLSPFADEIPFDDPKAALTFIRQKIGEGGIDKIPRQYSRARRTRGAVEFSDATEDVEIDPESDD